MRAPSPAPPPAQVLEEKNPALVVTVTRVAMLLLRAAFGFDLAVSLWMTYAACTSAGPAAAAACYALAAVHVAPYVVCCLLLLSAFVPAVLGLAALPKWRQWSIVVLSSLIRYRRARSCRTAGSGTDRTATRAHGPALCGVQPYHLSCAGRVYCRALPAAAAHKRFALVWRAADHVSVTAATAPLPYIMLRV